MPNTYTPKQVEEFLQISEKTLRNWRAQGKGPPWTQCEGVPRYPVNEFQSWLDENTRRPEDTERSTPGAQ